MLVDMVQLVAPPGWPRAVRPPGAPGWEHSAVSWLLFLMIIIFALINFLIVRRSVGGETR